MMLRQMAVAGSGLIFQPWFIVEEDVRAGKLVPVLPDFASDELGVYAVYPSRRHLSAKVRSFVDFLAAGLSGPQQDAAAPARETLAPGAPGRR